MDEFLRSYGLCIIISGIGTFFIVMTYLAYRARRSGVPLIGGILVAVGFLTSPLKILALLGLADPAFVFQPRLIVLDIRYKRARKMFEAEFERLGLAGRELTKEKELLVDTGDEKLNWHYTTAYTYKYVIPQLHFAIGVKPDGSRILMHDTDGMGKTLEVLPFDGESVTLKAAGGKKGPVDVVISEVEARS